MSEYMTRDISNELFDEICNRHWLYLDYEDSLQKLEQRTKLEDVLKEFLCIAPHKRKFLLRETAEVLKKSIQNVEDFSAQKAMNAFEAISYYANNIFSKPWRKEFRILRMYSGYYQHEINSNLLGAERLFKAMGYQYLSESTLIIDAPICPDQVSNVSLDAMTAYVELKIIKHIHNVLDASGIKCSWWDIFCHREKYIGGTTQAIKALTYAAEEKHNLSREKALINDNYGYIDVQPSANYLTSNTKFCPVQCHCHVYQHLIPTLRHQPMPQSNEMYCLPEHHQSISRTASNIMFSNMSYPAQHNYHYQQNSHAGLSAETGVAPLQQMSHSRSLEHYSEPSNYHQNRLPHRHSLDQQQQGCTAQHKYQYSNHPQQNYYESPYDCIDGISLGGGSSSRSYATVAGNAAAGTSIGNANCTMGSNSTYSHSYNFAGNRIPFPLNISNQISVYDNLQTSNYNGSKEPTYAKIVDQHNTYSSIYRQPQNCVVNTGTDHNSSGYDLVNQIHGMSKSSLSKDSLPRQRSQQSEQLISFDDPSIISQSTIQQQFDPLNQNQYSSYEPFNHIMDKRYIQPSTTTCQQHFIANKTATNDDVHVYAKPTPKQNRKPVQNPVNLKKPSFNTGERGGDTTDMSYESVNDDLTNLPVQLNQRNHRQSPTQFTKNQDGVGSFESWDYVYQNLERSGYSKDLGDREDLLVQSLHLDPLNISNDKSPSQASSAEKRRSNYAGNENKNTSQDQSQQQKQQQQQQRQPNIEHPDTKQKSQTFRNSKLSTKNNKKMEFLDSSSSTSNIQKQRSLIDNNEKNIKSALKKTNTTSKSYPNSNKAQPKNTDNKSTSKTLNNNIESSTTNIVENGTTARKNPAKSSLKKSGQSADNSSNAAATSQSAFPTQIIVTGSNEWSCMYCTFINPNSRRICEMCCRTKDNQLGVSSNSTAAATNAVAQNTTTCA